MSSAKTVENVISQLSGLLADQVFIDKCRKKSSNQSLAMLHIAVPAKTKAMLSEKDEKKIFDHFRGQGLPGSASYVKHGDTTKLVYSFQWQSPEIRKQAQEGAFAHLEANQR